MPRGDHSTARVHREWLQAVIERTGIKATTLAKRIKIAPSTLTRPLSEGDDGTSTLHGGTIDKIAAFTGIAPPGASVPTSRLVRIPGMQEDAAPYRAAAGDNDLAAAVSALTAGRNNADPWVIKGRALELAGYLPGDVVIVDLSALPRPGDVVCAQIKMDFAKGTAETVMRIYDRVGSSDILMAATLDPTVQRNLPVDQYVALKGVVVGAIRPGRQAA